MLGVAGVAQLPPENILRISRHDTAFESKKYDLAPFLYILPDSTAQLTIDDIHSNAFQHQFYLDSLQMLGTWASDMGQGERPFWVRLRVESELDFPISWLINFSAGEVILFVPDGSGGFVQKKSGLDLPMRDRYFGEQYGQLPCLPLDIPAGSSQTFFFLKSKTRRRFWETSCSTFSTGHFLHLKFYIILIENSGFPMR